MQVNKVENKKKFQPVFDWNCELRIPLEKKRKEGTFRPLSAFFSKLWGVQAITSTQKLVFFNSNSELSTVHIER